MTSPTERRCAALAVIAAGALLLSACGTGSSRPSLHDQLPMAVRDSGVIRVGHASDAVPVIFHNAQGQLDGLDPDVATALGKLLGVRFEYQDVGSFSNVLPGLLDKKYDVAMGGISDTRAREQGDDANFKQINAGVDFVDYFMSGISIIVRKGNPERLSGLDDLCGRTVAVKRGTVHDDLATRQQQACQHVGNPLKVLETDTDELALQQVRTGAADAQLNAYAKALYNTRSIDNGQTFELAGRQLDLSPFGIAVPKDDSGLRDVLAKAVNEIILDGTYDKILTKWGLSAGAVMNSAVNGGS